jgi:hypothetical protein
MLLDPDPRQPKECGSKWIRIRIQNTGKKNFNVLKSLMFSLEGWRFVQEFGNPSCWSIRNTNFQS